MYLIAESLSKVYYGIEIIERAGLIMPRLGKPLLLLEQTKEIVLAYNQNSFYLEFAGIHYGNLEGNQSLLCWKIMIIFGEELVPNEQLIILM